MVRPNFGLKPIPGFTRLLFQINPKQANGQRHSAPTRKPFFHFPDAMHQKFGKLT
ncbi:hypothetical protein ApDm4_0912 [Acetobacter pomorum]|nr:hypothetical protein ApDm4_0912 [Acetobacter pomorum]